MTCQSLDEARPRVDLRIRRGCIHWPVSQSHVRRTKQGQGFVSRTLTCGIDADQVRQIEDRVSQFQGPDVAVQAVRRRMVSVISHDASGHGQLRRCRRATHGLLRVAFMGRTSTEDQQDPTISIPWQLRTCRAVLPPHAVIVVHFYDAESGRNDLDVRGRGRRHELSPSRSAVTAAFKTSSTGSTSLTGVSRGSIRRKSTADARITLSSCSLVCFMDSHIRLSAGWSLHKPRVRVQHRAFKGQLLCLPRL